MAVAAYFTSSIGKKQILALTGLGLLGFVVTHLIGNFLIFLGADAFNLYAYTLTSNPLIYVAEAGLAGMFFGHIVLAMTLKVQNNQARPQRYYVKNMTGRGETWASKTMPLTGVILGIFVVAHLLNFKFGTVYMTTVNGTEMRDLYRLLIEYFSNPWYTAWYCFAMISLGIHTSHGFQSVFQTWGFRHKTYTPLIELAGLGYAAFVTIGFSACALYCYFQN